MVCRMEWTRVSTDATRRKTTGFMVPPRQG